MSRTVCVGPYELQVEITYCKSVKGDPTTWASDLDYYGYQEIEFEVVSGQIEDDAGNWTDLGRNGCDAVAEQYADDIEERLWQQLDDEQEDGE